MKKILLGLLAAILLLLAIGFLFREPLREQLEANITEDMFLPADTDSYDPGIAVGQRFPDIRAVGASGPLTDSAELMGDRGLVFVAVRSADWCPYCRKQLVQLQQQREAFAAAGIGLVALTYDSPELLAQFAAKYGISYPLLADVDTASVRALGILNEEYQPGDFAYGIPHPGVFIIAPDRRIVGKVFVQAYQQRVSAEAVLALARELLLPAG